MMQEHRTIVKFESRAEPYLWANRAAAVGREYE